MKDLNSNELIEISGGAEPAYGLGYLLGTSIRHNANIIAGGLYALGHYLNNI